MAYSIGKIFVFRKRTKFRIRRRRPSALVRTLETPKQKWRPTGKTFAILQSALSAMFADYFDGSALSLQLILISSITALFVEAFSKYANFGAAEAVGGHHSTHSHTHTHTLN